jgi:choline dehydrogenase-like flavoprotein
MLGGSSSINRMMWVRGFAAEYDERGELAGREWSFAEVGKYFERIENGPLVLSQQRSPRSSTAAWLKAAEQCGYRIEQPNQPAPEGLLRSGRDAAPGCSVEPCGCVPAAGAGSAEPDTADRGDRPPRAIRRLPGCRGRVR